MNIEALVNSIAVIANSIDTLNRAGEKEAISTLVAKLLELVKQLN